MATNNARKTNKYGKIMETLLQKNSQQKRRFLNKIHAVIKVFIAVSSIIDFVLYIKINCDRY